MKLEVFEVPTVLMVLMEHMMSVVPRVPKVPMESMVPKEAMMSKAYWCLRCLRCLWSVVPTEAYLIGCIGAPASSCPCGIVPLQDAVQGKRVPAPNKRFMCPSGNFTHSTY